MQDVPLKNVLKRLGIVALAGLALPLPAKEIKYYHLDAVGNVRVVTDQSGAVVERHDYLPFGEECTTGPCAGNPGLNAGEPRKFTGKERDRETGLDYFGARYYGARAGRFTAVDPVYTWRENLVDPQRWNRYAYGRNNPLRYVDPDGRAIETPWDAFNVGLGVASLSANVADGNWGGALVDAAGIGYDALATAVPVLPGGAGTAIRAVRAADKAVDLARGADQATDALQRGRQAEAAVLKALGETKNTSKVRGCEGCSIPDYQNATTIGEIKDAARVNNTRQLRIQREAAGTSGREHVVHTGTRTHVSGNVEARGTKVSRRDDLGPK